MVLNRCLYGRLANAPLEGSRTSPSLCFRATGLTSGSGGGREGHLFLIKHDWKEKRAASALRRSVRIQTGCPPSPCRPHLPRDAGSKMAPRLPWQLRVQVGSLERPPCSLRQRNSGVGPGSRLAGFKRRIVRVLWRFLHPNNGLCDSTRDTVTEK